MTTHARIGGGQTATSPAEGLERFEALLSPRGRELLDELAGQAVTPETALRVASALRAQYPPDLVSDALAQQALRLRAQAKFDRAGEMFFTRDGLEQASSEMVSRHRARRYAAAGSVADLCCGIGGDLIALAEHHRVLAVDIDPLHLRMAQVNADVRGVARHVRAVRSDARDIGLSGVDAAFIDPARRSGGRRLRRGNSEPPLEWCLALADRIGAVGVKAAPGLAHEDVPDGWELEFIAIRRDLKEAVAWSPAMATVARRATILPEGHTLVPAPGPPVPVRAPGEFLCDPSPAVTRAGLVQELARQLDAWKIDERIAFLSSDAPLSTPFGRGLRIIDSGPWNQKQLPGKLRALDIGAVDIRRRGLAGDVDRLLRQLKLTGSRPATVVMTRAQGRPWGLICLDAE
jgi:SAM-dependent methyltransferase